MMALTARGVRDENPIFHLVDDPPPRYSQTGKTYRARCGTQVRHLLNHRLPFARVCKQCEPNGDPLGEQSDDEAKS